MFGNNCLDTSRLCNSGRAIPSAQAALGLSAIGGYDSAGNRGRCENQAHLVLCPDRDVSSLQRRSDDGPDFQSDAPAHDSPGQLLRVPGRPPG
jgi:hypothetical protein